MAISFIINIDEDIVYTNNNKGIKFFGKNHIKNLSVYLSIQKILFDIWSGYTKFEKQFSICSFYKFSLNNIY